MPIPNAIAVIALICAVSEAPVYAANYYVSTTGSDYASGTSLTSPFLTIQKAASVVQAGDNVYVRGGTYRETVAEANSGTADSPITFQPYRGEDVTITGLDQLSSGIWLHDGGSNYHCAIAGNASQLFVGGNLMSEARSATPNYTNSLRRAFNTVGSASIQPESSGPSTIMSSSLGNPANGTWNGAKMTIVPGSGSEWVAFSTSVISQTGNTFSFNWSNDLQASQWTPVAGNRFYLYNCLAAVNSPKEYYYDSANSKLYLNSSVDPNTQNVEVRTRSDGFDLNGSNVILDGFRFKAANIVAQGNNNRINNCQVLYPAAFADQIQDQGFGRPNGVTINGENNTVSNSEIGCTWGSGVTVMGSNNTVNNNVIHDADWYGNDSAAIDISSTSHSVLTNNTIYNTGRSGIVHQYASNATIAHNDIGRFGYITKDLGGTYCGLTDGQGTVIAYNRIHDCIPTDLANAGVYIDNNSNGFTVHHNLVTNTPTGVRLNLTASDENVYNNTLWDVDQAMAGWGPSGTVMTNVATINNLSNSGSWVGNTLSNNRTQTANQFTNSAAGDYTLTANSGGTKRAVDYGTPISGITDIDGYAGSNPDAGALERGITIPDAHNVLTAGANWKAWTAGNQASAPLDAALYVPQSGTGVTTGSLMVGNTTSTAANNRSFLHFDLSGVVATTIQSAILRIYENTLPTSAAGSVTLNRVTSAWTNSNVSYNQSVDAASPITGFYDPSNLDLYTDINITSWVQGWLSNSSTNYGLRLCGTEDVTGTAKYFDGFYGVTAPQLVITMPEPGDANLDGKVDVSDLAILAANYRKHVTGGWTQADFNNDGVVDVKDLAILAANYRYGVASDVVPAYDGLDAAAIELLSLAGVTVAPEPGTLVMLAVALIGTLAYAWRKQK